MSRRVFISYRRDDSAAWAGRLYERFLADYAESEVFLDVDQIAPGDDYVKVLENEVRGSDTCLVMIGPKWIDARNPDGRRRLDDPGDFVRVEIETAFAEGLVVVPVLIEGAARPSLAELPPSLAKLVDLPAVSLDHESFDQAAGVLVATVRKAPRRARAAAAGKSKATVSTVVNGLGRAVVYVVFLGILAAAFSRQPLLAAVIMVAITLGMPFLMRAERALSVYIVWFVACSLSILWAVVTLFPPPPLSKGGSIVQAFPVIVWGILTLAAAVVYYVRLRR